MHVTQAALLLSLYVASPCVVAQIHVDVVTKTAVTVVASTAHGAQDQKSIPARSQVANGFDLTATASSQVPGGTLFGQAQSELVVSKPTGSAVIRFDNRATATWAGGFTAFANAGPHRVVVSLSSPTPLAGRLLMSIQGSATRFSTSSSAVDLGDDGKIDLSNGSRAVAVVLGPEGLRIGLAGEATAALGTAATNVTLTFIAGAGPLQTVGAPCRGPAMEAMFTGTLYRLGVSNVPAGHYPLIVFGITDPNLGIPPFGCLLRTDILIGVGLPVAGGRAELNIPLTGQEKGLLRSQFLIVHGGGWVTSNAIIIKLP